MDAQWVLECGYERVVAAILDFEWPAADLLVKPLQEGACETCFGLYVPTQPRPTSILAGELRVRRLGKGKVLLRAVNCFDWAGKALEELVQAVK